MEETRHREKITRIDWQLLLNTETLTFSDGESEKYAETAPTNPKYNNHGNRGSTNGKRGKIF